VAESRDSRLIVLAFLVLLIAFGVLLDNGLATAVVRSNMYDFLCFYGGATGLLRGVNYYDRAYASAIAPEFGYESFLNVYPPLSSAYFVPISLLPWEVAKRVWLLISLVALGGFAWLLGRWFLRDLEGTPRLLWTAVGLLLLVSFFPLRHALQVGQSTFVNGALILAVLYLACQNRDRQAGALLAATFFFKPTIIVILLYALLKRRWQLLGWSLFGILLLGVLSVALLGLEIHEDFVAQMTQRFSRLDAAPNYQDLYAFWGRALDWPGAPVQGYAHLARPLAHASAAVLMIPVIVLLVRRRWDQLSGPEHLLQFGLLFTVGLIAQNQSAIYEYLLLAMPMAAAAVYLREMEPRGRSFWLHAAGLAAAWCLIALPFGFREEALQRGVLVLAISSKLYGSLILWAVLISLVRRSAAAQAGRGADESAEVVVAE
jgi:hypothetical protein